VTTPGSAVRGDEHTVIQTAVRGMLERLPELTDRLVAELKRGEDPADRGRFDDDAFWNSAHAGLRAALQAVASHGRERPDLSYARRIGRRYAEQDVQLDTALRAYRLAGSLLWEGMVEVVTEKYPEYLPVLLTGARRTFQMTEQLSTSSTESYHQARQELRQARLGRSYEVLDDLLDGRGADGTLVESAAAALDLPEHGHYVVVAVRTAGSAQADTPLPGEAGGMRLIWRTRPGTLIGVVPPGTWSLDVLAEALTPLVPGRAGIGLPVHHLADLGNARRLAEVALRTCTGEGPEIARLDHHLPAALLAARPDLAGHLREVVLGPLLDLRQAERELLLDTLTAWLDSAGSTSRAAERLFCHRNTVLGRIHRVERLTGRRLGHPREAVELILALEAVRLDPLPRA
jgi:hypothetical protein